MTFKELMAANVGNIVRTTAGSEQVERLPELRHSVTKTFRIERLRGRVKRAE